MNGVQSYVLSLHRKGVTDFLPIGRAMVSQLKMCSQRPRLQAPVPNFATRARLFVSQQSTDRVEAGDPVEVLGTHVKLEMANLSSRMDTMNGRMNKIDDALEAILRHVQR